MATLHPLNPSTSEPVALHDRAMDNLRYIRETMERAGSFTAVSGWGVVAIGVTALGAAGIAALQETAVAWLVVWSLEAMLALGIAAWSVARKARLAGVPLLVGPGRKVALSLSPVLAAGAVLTAVLFTRGMIDPLPGAWMLLFGAGVVAAGSNSVRIVPVMGLSFMLVGTVAFLLPSAWGDGLMALGFGGLHLLFGTLIARRYGG
jgi:hypothetical protein